ncbi:hypothetical protein RHMOL_Rhmol09G0153600 [Rhododendron molle]|uniref:Uncharacterized protein n=1 Tax=Rhododendron molle TaxID=49168 RepID=A0ACC0MDW4_RHOML|nr:hypothetical protein RHMOL_Rhmol09G0153600 [Rhododendron molle]
MYNFDLRLVVPALINLTLFLLQHHQGNPTLNMDLNSWFSCIVVLTLFLTTSVKLTLSVTAERRIRIRARDFSFIVAILLLGSVSLPQPLFWFDLFYYVHLCSEIVAENLNLNNFVLIHCLPVPTALSNPIRIDLYPPLDSNHEQKLERGEGVSIVAGELERRVSVNHEQKLEIGLGGLDCGELERRVSVLDFQDMCNVKQRAVEPPDGEAPLIEVEYSNCERQPHSEWVLDN